MKVYVIIVPPGRNRFAQPGINDCRHPDAWEEEPYVANEWHFKKALKEGYPDPERCRIVAGGNSGNNQRDGSGRRVASYGAG